MDYTHSCVEKKFASGKIQACPYCGRNGLAETTKGRTVYVHKHTIKMVNGKQTNEWEQCPADGAPLRKTVSQRPVGHCTAISWSSRSALSASLQPFCFLPRGKICA